jgi:hypothetical protein
MPDFYEFKIINKAIMAERTHPQGTWRIVANIFEVVRGYLLWSNPDTMLPHIVPGIEGYKLANEKIDNLAAWYSALSRPNSPIFRTWTKPKEEYYDWLRGLDLSTPVDHKKIKEFFTDSLRTKKASDVDEVAIAEAETFGIAPDESGGK